MSRRYSDLFITDEVFDESVENLADENGFSYAQFIGFVEKLPEKMNFSKQDNDNGYEEWVSLWISPNHAIDCISAIVETFTAYEFANGFMIFGERDSMWD